MISPSVITNFPKRWASPQIRGKRIAIDGTLLTNRFHFAVQDGPLKGKGGLIGWFNLINVLRRHDITPVAIWDERGVREWKAPEATRRLAVRAMNLSRRSHEEERADRLAQWKEAITELRSLPEDERFAVQTLFSGSIASNPPPTRIAVQEVLEETPTFDSDEMEPALDRITSLIDDLSNLRLAYEARSTIPSTRVKTDDITQALQHVSELERLYETVHEPHRVKDIMRSPPEEEETSVLDEKLEEVISEEAFRESKRQRLMTVEEGDIVNTIFGVGVLDTSPPLSKDESAGTRPTGGLLEDEGSAFVGLAVQEGDDLTTDTDSDTRRVRKQPRDTIGAALADSHDIASHTSDQSTRATISPTPQLDPEPETTADPMERLDHLIKTSPEVKQVYERALAMPTPSDHDACMELVTRMGVPVIKAGIPYEAEGLAASLARSGLVDFVGTEDSDVIAYKAPLLRNVSSSSRPLTLISGQALRETTTLSSSAFIDFCILLGTDASPRIPGIGPHRAYKLILAHQSIEEILAKDRKVMAKLTDAEGFMKLVNSARAVFGELPPIPSRLDLELKEYNQAEVEKWLQEEHGVMFLDAEDIGGTESFENEADRDEELGPVPEVIWDENLGDPGNTAYDIENGISGSDQQYIIEDSHR